MSNLKIQIIIGSVREGRFCDKPATWIFEQAKKRTELEVELLDLRDYPLPFFDEPKSPKTADGVYVNPAGAAWAEKIGEADGYIFVTPEYNHGYSAVLKNSLDWVYKQWNNKPVAFVSYGVAGGVRAVEQLRQVVGELQMVSVSNAVHIPAFWTLLDEQGNLKTESFEGVGQVLLNQLTTLASSLKQMRNTNTNTL